MNKDVMNQGVQILLDRMDTNPEEFEEHRDTKWGDIVQAVHARVKEKTEGKDYGNPLPFLSDAEVNALYDKLEDVRRENFTADVLRRLADAPNLEAQEDLFDTKYSTSSRSLTANISAPTGVVTTGSSWGKSSVTLAEVQALSKQQKQDILDLMEEYKKREMEGLYPTPKKQKAKAR